MPLIRDVCVHSVAHLCLTICDPWMVVCQAPLSIKSSRQEYWSGLSFPTPGDLPDPGMELTSLVLPAMAGRFFTDEPPCRGRVKSCNDRDPTIV